MQQRFVVEPQNFNRPVLSGWSVEQLHPHVAGNTNYSSSENHPQSRRWGKASIDSLVSPCEREETRTRPWSVLSVVEKGSNTGF